MGIFPYECTVCGEVCHNRSCEGFGKSGVCNCFETEVVIRFWDVTKGKNGQWIDGVEGMYHGYGRVEVKNEGKTDLYYPDQFEGIWCAWDDTPAGEEIKEDED